jgi:hypothetical protein
MAPPGRSGIAPSLEGTSGFKGNTELPWRAWHPGDRYTTLCVAMAFPVTAQPIYPENVRPMIDTSVNLFIVLSRSLMNSPHLKRKNFSYKQSTQTPFVLIVAHDLTLCTLNP